MFKRLSKGRRHSVEEDAGNAASKSTALQEPPGVSLPRKNSDGQLHVLNSTLLRSSRAKYTRKSCGDAATFAMLVNDEVPDAKVNVDADYQMVTAVPAFIVEHEPDKQRGLNVWGFRKMSKKIDSFRRAGSRERISPIIERLDANSHNNNNDVANNNKNNKNNESPESKPTKGERGRFGSMHRSPSPFKSFFIRMGSTGMLNATKGNRRSQVIDDRHKTTEKENLFRSCSTSQLNTSPTYVKGDDPSEGIDLQLNSRKDKTVSCDNLNDAQDEDTFDDAAVDLSNTCSSVNGGVFSPCDFGESRSHDALRKSNSCDFKEVKKSSFPYAFLRSKLSVLPEERHGSCKDERLFKTASEEHFPTLIVEDTFEGTTTLGRRRSKTGSYSPANRDLSSRNQDMAMRYTRNSYAESCSERMMRCEKDRYSLNSSHLERIENNAHLEDSCYGAYRTSPMSLPAHPGLSLPCREPAMDLSNIPESRYPDSVSLIMDSDGGPTLRNYRRNSAPSEQRLSSHYVSSNESGYDSDGPRGSESTAASENEALSLKCTDSSDTSSVLDSEIEKPIRGPSPNDCTEDDSDSVRTTKAANEPQELVAGETLDGLRWHQSTSGRMLPSIHQTSSVCSSHQLAEFADQSRSKSPAVLSHRAKMQLEKTRFLSDIIQPPKKVKRCRIVQLTKKDPKEHLGIRLAQQRFDELRYVIVQLESDGIAHRDGRLRLGDEIIEVEGKDLRTMESLEQVQNFLKSFTGNKVRLKTVYEETVPQVYVSSSTFPGECEYLENAKNLSKMSLLDSEERRASPLNDSTKSSNDAAQPRKRPDYLPLGSSAMERKHTDSSVDIIPETQQYLSRHIARFEKGYGRPSLGFSVVGGRDSPRGDMGIFVRRVFPGGQADVSKTLFQGDEIISLNGKVLRGCTHQEVIELFKAVREGAVELELARRHRYQKNGLKSAPC